MNRPRVPLGLEATRATLNRAACAEVGAELAAARASRNLSIQDVATRLLLSPAQVTALEQLRPDAFYGAEFYAAAVRKYAAFVEIRPSALDRLLLTAPGADAPLPFKRQPKAVERASVGAPRPRNGLVVAVGLGVTGLVGSLFMASVVTRPNRSTDRRAAASPASELPEAGAVIQPATRTLANQHAPAAASQAIPDAAELEPVNHPVLRPARTELTPAVAVESRGGVVGHVSVTHDTWIFVRYQDNTTVERRVRAGDVIELAQRPVYLALGVADGVSVVVGGHPLDIAKFTANGQLRVGAAYFATLQMP